MFFRFSNHRFDRRSVDHLQIVARTEDATQHRDEISCPRIVGGIVEGGEPKLPHLGLRIEKDRNHGEFVDEEELGPQKVDAFDEMVDVMKRKWLGDDAFFLDDNCIHVVDGLIRIYDLPTIAERYVPFDGKTARIHSF